jgi:hypothetical protein
MYPAESSTGHNAEADSKRDLDIAYIRFFAETSHSSKPKPARDLADAKTTASIK